MTKQDMNEILKQVKNNIDLLNGCEGPHEFKPQSGKLEPTFGEKYKCTKCGGTVDHIACSWYKKGLAHGSLLEEITD